MSRSVRFALTVGICMLLPFMVPQHSLTILVEALIFGLFAMSLDLLVGFVQVLGAYYFQDLALAFMYFLMLTVLVIRPGGLLGREE